MTAQPPRQHRPRQSFSSDSLTPPPLPPDPTADSRALAAMQSELDQARDEYARRRYDEVTGRIERLFADLTAAGNLPRQDVERRLLRASTLSLAARLAARLRSEADARPQFQESVRIFDALREQIAQNKGANCLFTDYAIGLARTGREPEAEAMLESVCNSGAAPAEAFGYLGYCYKQRGQLVNAEDAYRKGLQLTPRDPPLLRYLAEALEAAGPERRDEALAMYCDAALAWAQTGDLDMAAELAHKALDMDPMNADAVKVAFVVDRARNDVDGCASIVKRVLAASADHPWGRALHGLLLREAGHLEDAVKEFEAVRPDSPDLSWVLIERARSIRELHPDQVDQSIALLLRAIELNPHDASAFVELAQIHLGRNDPDKAVDLLHRALEIDPQEAALHAELGRVEMLRTNYNESLDAYQRALAIEPRSVPALAGRAAALRALQRYDEAIEAFHRALHVDPDAGGVLESMVDTLVELQRTDEALEELDADIARAPDRSQSYWQKGRLLLDRRDYRGALEALTAADTREPDQPGILLNLATTLKNVGNYERARATFDRVVKLQEEWPYALATKASFLSDIAEFKEGEALAARAVSLAAPEGVTLDKEDQSLVGWICGVHAWCLEHLGDKDAAERARQQYERAATLDPGNQVWHWKGLGNSLCRVGRGDEAVKVFQKILAEQKYKAAQDVEHLWLLGWCHYRLGRYDEAARFVQAAVSNDTSGQNRPNLQFDLGLIYLATARATLGVKEYDRGIEAARAQHPLRQRGIFYVGLFDLVEAAQEQRIGPECAQVFATLREQLSESGVDVKALRWLGDELPACQSPTASTALNQ